MPLTPFHFGPGAVVKAVFPRRFSFSIFCAAQVITDLEPGYFLLRHEYPVHRWAHTFLGATGVAVLTVLIAGPFVRWFHRQLAEKTNGPFGKWLEVTDLSWTGMMGSALVGTLSHVLLDSFMHSDARPFAPFTSANPFLGVVSLGALHWGCVACGLGAFVCACCFAPKAKG